MRLYWLLLFSLKHNKATAIANIRMNKINFKCLTSHSYIKAQSFYLVCPRITITRCQVAVPDSHLIDIL